MFVLALSPIAAALVVLLSLISSPGFATPDYRLPDLTTPQIQLKSAGKPSLWVSCRHPNRKAYGKRRGVMRYTLKHGDIGGCYTDKRADHSAPHVPYMERVEMFSGFRPVGPRYRFSAQIHMDPNYQSSANTTVFQVHQWVQESCRCGPPVMLSFAANGQLMVWILTAAHDHAKLPLKGWSRASFEDKWVEIAVDISSAYGRRNVTIWLGGNKVLSHQALIQRGGALFMKTGLYRPGSRKTRLPTDQVHIKNPRIGIMH